MLQPRRAAGRAGLRRRAAIGAAHLVAGLSRRLGLGGGSTIGGRVGLAIDPGLLAAAGSGRRIALVSGTNGKTTTTRLLAAALGRVPPTGGSAPVATSTAGANMPAGLVAALLAAPVAPLAALEVDEGYVPAALAALAPEVVVLLNLTRDQLDRVSEVRQVASRWREALVATEALVVANADDPLVVWAASGARRTRYVAAGGRWHEDAYHCPACDARLCIDARGGGWSCACGLERPESSIRLEGDSLVAATGEAVALGLRLPGRFNRANAALAAAGAEALGVPLVEAVAAMREVTEVAGRYATFPLGPGEARLLLAKNPAGFDELLALVEGGGDPAVVVVNARDADGHDPSWLWDVAFERLAGRHVVASGERRLDLAVRLRHAEVAHDVADDPLAAARRLASAADARTPRPHEADGAALGGEDGGRRVELIANYTAFQDLRRRLGAGTAASDLPPTSPPRGASETGTGRHQSAPRRRPGTRRGNGESALRVVVVHPDLLGTYGDGGNGLVLANRARWRGLPAELVLASSDRPLPVEADLYCLGGGEDGPQSRSAAVLADGTLARAVDKGAAVLAVCAGFQILGTTFAGADGLERAGVGLLDVTTVRGPGRRAVGELAVAPLVDAAPDPSSLATASPLEGGGDRAAGLLAGVGVLSGFENHAGRTILGTGTAALGRVVRGTGSDGRVDGAVRGRIVGTYLHGPVLARNPRLADALLGAVLGRALEPLADDEEEALRAERLARLAPVGGRALR